MTDKKPIIDEIDRLWNIVPDHDHHDALYNIQNEIPGSFVKKNELNADDWHVMGFHDGLMCVMDYDESGSVSGQDFEVPLNEFSIGILRKFITVLQWYENMCETTEDRAEWGPSAFGDPDAPRPL